MNITSIPTIMAFKDGIGVFAQAGALPRPVLDDLIGRLADHPAVAFVPRLGATRLRALALLLAVG